MRHLPALLALALAGACASAPAPVRSPGEEPLGRLQSALTDASAQRSGDGREQAPNGRDDGRIAVVIYFATWAEGARALLPALDALRLDPEVTVSGVGVDEDSRFVEPYARELGLGFPVIADPGGRTTRPQGLRRIPTVLVFDTDGALAAAFEGADDSVVKAVEKKVAALRQAAAPPAP